MKYLCAKTYNKTIEYIPLDNAHFSFRECGNDYYDVWIYIGTGSRGIHLQKVVYIKSVPEIMRKISCINDYEIVDIADLFDFKIKER